MFTIDIIPRSAKSVPKQRGFTKDKFMIYILKKLGVLLSVSVYEGLFGKRVKLTLRLITSTNRVKCEDVVGQATIAQRRTALPSCSRKSGTKRAAFEKKNRAKTGMREDGSFHPSSRAVLFCHLPRA